MVAHCPAQAKDLQQRHIITRRQDRRLPVVPGQLVQVKLTMYLVKTIKNFSLQILQHWDSFLLL